eukprot:scaffold80958_cov24-Tisochrysis_lutea.AAC.3
MAVSPRKRPSDSAACNATKRTRTAQRSGLWMVTLERRRTCRAARGMGVAPCAWRPRGRLNSGGHERPATCWCTRLPTSTGSRDVGYHDSMRRYPRLSRPDAMR